ncbi:PhzF family isomerase [Pectinatus frisingensis]|uniref:PhzF family isomerase n=1 Tax=Pectinatus frisingensis TaxID=865 RepID=UPI0018C7A988|nr:PhzF family isomerase [Pectinatus frisingensis]
MKKYKIYQVDSFTRQKFHGNPAGVVPNAEGLTDEQMQQIARELNNSETAFIFPSTSAAYDVEVRFFTPTMEVPICGHATIAAHYVRAIEGAATSGRIIQKTRAGMLPVDIIRENNDYSIIMTQGTPKIGNPFNYETVKRIAHAIGIEIDYLRSDCPVAISSTGHSKVMVGIRSNKYLHELKPNLAELTDISAEIGCNGYYVFTLNPNDEILVHGRMFAPAIGIVEDPVTGNANGPLGAYLVHYGICKGLEKEDSFNFSILQGEAINRDGGMRVFVKKKLNKPILVQIIGEAVIAFSSEFEI